MILNHQYVETGPCVHFFDDVFISASLLEFFGEMASIISLILLQAMHVGSRPCGNKIPFKFLLPPPRSNLKAEGYGGGEIGGF